MTAIITGNGLGLQRSSANLLGANGQLGSAGAGRAPEGVTVNAATGSLVIQTQDEILVGRGPDAVFASSYNSLGALNNNYTNLDGTVDTDGWLLSTQRKIVLTGTANTAGSTATLTDWDGTQVVFTYNTTGAKYVSSEYPYSDDTLTWASNVFTYTEGQSRAVQTFASNIGGRLIDMKDADGNSITYTYDLATTAGKLTRVTTANSNGTQFNYVDLVYGTNSSGNKQITLTTSYSDLSITPNVNKSLSRIVYTYDSNLPTARLRKIIVDLTPLDGADLAAYTMTFTYKDATSKLITGIQQSDGTNYTIAYDASNRVQSITQAMTGTVSQTTTFAYDTTNKVTTITDALSNIYKMTYDAQGRLTRLEEPAPTGAAATVKTFTYATVNTNQLLITALTFDNPANVGNAALALETSSSLYDVNYNLLERVLADNTSVKYTYGSLNQVLTETHYTGLDANGVADGVAPTGALVTQYVYDEAANGVGDDGSATDDTDEKHLRFVVSAEGRVTEFQYNGFGQLISTIVYTGAKYTGTTFSEVALNTWVGTANDLPVQRINNIYDFRGNLNQSTSWSSSDTNGAGVTTQDWSRVDYVYDMAGRLLTRKTSGANALGGEATPATETFVYDGLGRVISTTDLFGQTTTVTITDNTRTTTIATANDPARTLVNNVAGTLQSDAYSSGGTALGTTSYAYDALGRLRMATDALGVNTYFTYDKQNRLTATIDGDGTMTEYKYDGADRVIATVTYANAVSAANLTILGTATTNTEVATVRPAVTTSDRWNWTIYNKAGRLIETIDGTGAATQLNYDGAGRLLTTIAYRNVLSGGTLNGADGVSGYRTAPPTAAVLPVTNIWEDRTSQNLYDSDGLLVGMVLQQAGSGNGQLAEYVYDAAGRLIDSIKYANTVTAMNWQGKTLAQIKAMLTLDAANDTHSYRLYDGRGRLGAAIDGEGNVMRYHYTARGDLDQQIIGQKVTASTTYTLATLAAASGTLETTRWYRNAAGLVTSQVRMLTSGTETTTYTYDTRGRLLSQTVSETISTETRTQTFRYDAKGRLASQLSGEGSAALGALGASPTQAQIDGIYASWGTTYTYDMADRLIATVTPDGTGASGVKTLYYYDGDGQLRYEINALGEVVEHQFNVLEDQVATIAYGTRIAAGTLATLTGGLVTATVTNAVSAYAALDSKIQATFDNRGQQSTATDALGNVTTFSYNAFGQTSLVAGPVLAGPNVAFQQSMGYYTDGRFWYSNTFVNGNTAASVAPVVSYDLPTAEGLATRRTLNNTDQRTVSQYFDRAGRMTRQRDAMNAATTLTYDPRSNVVSSTDRNNQTSTFVYDLFNRNITATTAEGITTSVKKNAYGQTILITDGKGQTRSYTYDKSGNLKAVTDAAGTTNYSYDKADRLIDVIDAKGVDTHYTYDAVGRVLTEVRDCGSGKINLTTSYAYDAKGQTISVTDALGAVTNYAYDLNGQKTRIVQDAGSGKLNITTDFAYRADGKVISQTDAVGTAQARTTTFDYDTLGRMTKKVEDAGSGKLNITTLYYYDVNNNLVATTDALGRTSRFVYDLNSRLALTIDAEGEVTQTYYDGEDRAIATRQFVATLSSAQLAALADLSQSAQWTDFSVAANGDLTLTRKVKDQTTGAITTTTAATITTATADRVTRTFYDGDGRAVYSVDAEGYVTQNVYARANNVIQTIRYAAQTSLTNASTTANVAALYTTTLNGGGLATNIPADAAVTVYTYDGANRLTDVATQFDSGVGFNNDNVTTHFVLDALGQITDTIVAYGSGDAVTTHRVFDNVGRVTSETRDYGSGNLNLATSFTYDAHGMTTSVTDGRGNVTTMSYDALGRMLSQSVPLDASNSALTSFQYDARGNRVALTDPRGNSSYFYYDNLDRVVLQVDAEGYVVKTEYAIGSVVSKVTRYAGAASNLASMSSTVLPTFSVIAAVDAASQFTYDKLDRVKTAVDALGNAESYSYDALGNRTSVTNKLGGVSSYTYDKRGLLRTEAVDQASFDANGNPLLEGAAAATRVVTSYTYDARGNLKTKVVGSNFTAANQLTTTFDFDKVDRLIKQTDPSFSNPDLPGTSLTPVTTWTYDKRGDVVQQTAPDGGKTFSYFDHLGRKTAELSPVNELSSWLYDASGNVMSQTRYANRATIAVDQTTSQAALVANVNALDPGNRTTTLGYDRNNRLTQSVIVGVRTGSFNGSAYSTSTNQNLTSSNQYDSAGNLIKEVDANGGAIYHFYNKAGREIAKLDQEQFLTNWTRDADGNVLVETRFATKYTGTPVAGGAAPGVATSADDRITTFTYDQMGRRLTEERGNVLVTAVSGGTITAASQTSKVTYAYNELGEVKSKQEATSDRTDYQYDTQGRLERQLDAVQTDFNSSGTATVRHVTYFKYDCTNNLVQATERAEAGTAVPGTPGTSGVNATGYTATDDRISRYTYAGGKLTGMTDPLNFARSYTYDLAGRRTAEYYTRTSSDGTTTVTEGNFTSYGSAGRAVTQWQASGAANTPTSTWAITWPQTLLSYNAFGEVASRSVKASANDNSPLLQEQMTYDNAGRVVKTNAGDGVWKVMIYDANGNATLSIGAISRDMASLSAEAVITSIASFDTMADAANTVITDIAATISTFDKRNMASSTREPVRQIDGTTNRYTVTRGRTYTAFGEVASDTDARGYLAGNTPAAFTTNYTYNTLGRMVRSEAPTVSITNEDGSAQFVRPATDSYYDASGRLVATRDASGTYATGGTASAGTSKAANTGNLTTRVLLAGTGYGGSEAKVLKEFRPDGSIWASRYDAFGGLRVSIDAINSALKAASLAYVTTTQLTDKANRVTQITRPATAAGTLIESFSYDGLGNRIGSRNSLYGTAQASRTDYDALGRVTLQVSQGGDRVVTSYAWNSVLSTTGLGVAGGWIKTAAYQNETATTIKTAVTKTDSFGHEIEKTDMGGHVFASTYDKAGRLASRGAQSFTWFNTGQLASTSGDFGTESYSYDASGNRTREYLTAPGGVIVRKDATTTYDAMGRAITWSELANATLPDAATTTSYDANGNIRRTQASWRTIDQYGTPNPYGTNNYDYWYRYDSSNRLVTDMGTLSGTAGAVGTTIARGINNSNDPQSGRDIFYDANGQRVSVATTFYRAGYWDQQTPPNTLPSPDDPYVYVNAWWQEQRENYTFDAAGRLTEVRTTAGSQVNETWTPEGGGDGVPSGPLPGASSTGGGLVSALGYDLLGRQVSQEDTGWAKGSVFTGTLYTRTIGYNAKNQVIAEDAYTVKAQYGNNTYDTFHTIISYDYGSGAAYALGSVIGQTVTNTKRAYGSTSWSNQPGTLTQTSYAWYDGAVQAAVYHDSDTGDGNTIASVTASGNFGGGTKVFRTAYTLNALGQVAGAAVQDGIPKTNSYVLDGAGQIIRHDESRNSAPGEGAPHEVFYRFAGKQIGVSGNNGTGGVAFTQSVSERSAATPSQSDSTAGLFRNGTRTGAAAFADFSQSYTAFNTYSQGSAAGAYTVRAGDTLQGIAQGLWGDASLWYKLAEANGLSGSAALSEGQRLSLPAGVTSSAHNASSFKPYDASEALGNTLPTTPQPPKKNKCGVFGQILATIVAVVATHYLGPIGGNLVSQGFNNLIGVQHGFSVKSLVTSYLTAGIAPGNTGNFVVDLAANALTNLAVQGIEVATRLQKSIDWAGVAAAGISGAVGGQFGGDGSTKTFGKLGAQIVGQTAGGLAGAAATSVVTGRDFGDTLLAELPALIGQVAGAGINAGIGGKKVGLPDDGLDHAAGTVFNFLRTAIAGISHWLGGWTAGSSAAPETGAAHEATHAALGDATTADQAAAGAGAGDTSAIVVTGSRYQPIEFRPFNIDGYLNYQSQQNLAYGTAYARQQMVGFANHQASSDEIVITGSRKLTDAQRAANAGRLDRAVLAADAKESQIAKRRNGDHRAIGVAPSNDAAGLPHAITGLPSAPVELYIPVSVDDGLVHFIPHMERLGATDPRDWRKNDLTIDAEVVVWLSKQALDQANPELLQRLGTALDFQVIRQNVASSNMQGGPGIWAAEIVRTAKPEDRPQVIGFLENLSKEGYSSSAWGIAYTLIAQTDGTSAALAWAAKSNAKSFARGVGDFFTGIYNLGSYALAVDRDVLLSPISADARQRNFDRGQSLWNSGFGIQGAIGSFANSVDGVLVYGNPLPLSRAAGTTVTGTVLPMAGRAAAGRLSGLAAEGGAPLARTYNGGAHGRLSSQARVIERHHMPPNSLGFTTKYSGPAIQIDYADHLLTSSRGSSFEATLYRTEIQDMIDARNMRGAMVVEIRDIRRVAVEGGGSITKYNSATREMLDYTYGKGWLGK